MGSREEVRLYVALGALLLIAFGGLFFWSDSKVTEANSLPGALTRGVTALFAPNSSRALEANVQQYQTMRTVGIGGMLLAVGTFAFGAFGSIGKKIS